MALSGYPDIGPPKLDPQGNPIEKEVDVELVDGSLRTTSPYSVVVDDERAAAQHLSVGDTVELAVLQRPQPCPVALVRVPEPDDLQRRQTQRKLRQL